MLQVLALSLAFASFWVHTLKIGVTKPFTCVKCMCGWFTIPFSLYLGIEHWFLMPPLGVLVGAIYSNIKMRWL